MPLDEADIKKITELTTGIVTEALKASGTETAKLIDASIGKAIKGLDIDKKLEGLKTETDKKLEGIKVDPPKDPPKDPPGGDDSPALRKLQAEQEKLQKALEAQTKRAEEAETKRRADLLQNSVRDALIAQGADPKRVALALPVLKERGTVRLDDKGAPVFTFQRNGYEESLDVTAGAKEWLSTDDGKIYMPPVGTQGTGGGLGGSGGRVGPTGNPEQIALNALANLL